MTLGDAITAHFSNFLAKREASADFRPCTAHDLAPAYMTCLGLTKAELEDECFLSRLRRQGLPEAEAEAKTQSTQEAQGADQKKKGKKKG